MVVSLDLGCRQGTFVHLLVLVQRDDIDLHRCSRHHVRRLAFADEGIEGRHVDRRVADNIGGDELTSVGVVEGLNGRVLDAFELTNDGFDLFELDTETAYLDLSVTSADKLNIAVRQVTDYIAGAVAAFAVPGDKGLSGLLRQVEVAATHLRTTYPQFAGCTERQTLAVGIHDEELQVIQRLADGDMLLVFAHEIGRGEDGTFGRSVAVMHLIFRRRVEG